MDMFHTGDLQSGISLAIQQQKLVACFVRQDDDDTSDLWEREWLASDDSSDDSASGIGLATTIQDKAVLLRIKSGSQEAGFLSAFCPIDKAPTLVIIQNGTVLEKLESPMEREEWTDMLLKALGAKQPDPVAKANDSVLENHAQQTDTTAGSSPSSPSQPSAAVQSLLAERGQRLELTRLRREAQEKQDALARQRALREEAEAASSQPSDKGKGKARATSPASSSAPDEQRAARHKARVDWVQTQAKRKHEAAEEKERIRAQIEADKLERRRREEERKQAASSMAASPLPPASSSRPTAEPASRSTSSALQIRLFDGSAIKSRFAPSATLGTSVRTWISSASPPGQGGADIPYNFRLLQTPAPSRTIGDSEEHQPLSEIGLGAGGTLVLVPVQGYTEAYSGSTGVAGSAVGLVSGAVGWLGSGLGYLTGYGQAGGRRGHGSGGGGGGLYIGGTSDEGEESNVRGARMAGAETGTGDGSVKTSGGGRMKTLADQRAEDGEERREFYNGNSLGFEPRRDDGDEEEGKGR